MAVPGGRDGSGQGGFRDEGGFLSEEELALPANERLPWLESDDEDEDLAIDTGRIVTFAVASVLAIAIAGAALWWTLGRPAEQRLVADGSTIEAPDEPYRKRPDNPGGMQVAGTGDTSFAVAEGRQVDARLAPSEPPAPSIDIAQEAVEDDEEPAPPAPSGIGVQVGAYSTHAQAQAGWSTLVSRMEPLQGRSHRVVEGRTDSGRVFRLQAVAGDLADANALCGAIKAAGGDCQVKR